MDTTEKTSVPDRLIPSILSEWTNQAGTLAKGLHAEQSALHQILMIDGQAES